MAEPSVSCPRPEPKRFLAQYKCECFSTEVCNCPRKTSSAQYFLANVKDVAATVADVMMICGIHEAKAKAAIELAVHALLHYDEIRHRIDAAPKKRLCKEDLIHELGRKCLMTRMEAQLAYTVIKRAFKAFYHGTTEGGIRNRALEAEALHSQECLWVHAARRTAQIFASYEGMFLTAQRTYEKQIRCAYKKLYDKLTSRKFPLNPKCECRCGDCNKNHQFQPAKSSHRKFNLSSKRSALDLHKTREDGLPADACPLYGNTKTLCCGNSEDSELSEELPHPKAAKSSNKIGFEVPKCFKCNCPKLICERDINRDTGVHTTECSQGPYKCLWLPVVNDEDDDQPDPCITIPEQHECPVDCDSDSQSSCDSECECDCSESCECLVEDNSSGYEEDNQAANLDAEGLEAESEGQLEDEPPREPPYELPDMSERQPAPRYAGCRVPMNYGVEQQPTAETAAAIAAVEEHQKNSFAAAAEPVKPLASPIIPGRASNPREAEAKNS